MVKVCIFARLEDMLLAHDSRLTADYGERAQCNCAIGGSLDAAFGSAETCLKSVISTEYLNQTAVGQGLLFASGDCRLAPLRIMWQQQQMLGGLLLWTGKQTRVRIC